MVEYSDKNSRNFASLEKKTSESKLIPRHQIDNKINTDQKEILSETEKYYKKLYSKRESRYPRHNCFDETIPKLNQAEQEKSEGIISEVKCIKAIKDLTNQNSPSSDGITVEFYKLFWNDIKQYYINLINYLFRIRIFN